MLLLLGLKYFQIFGQLGEYEKYFVQAAKYDEKYDEIRIRSMPKIQLSWYRSGWLFVD
jgi:hypothetical protein